MEKTGFDIVTPQLDIFCRQVLERSRRCLESNQPR
jgi:hypothetical protein